MDRPLRFCMITTFYPPYNFGGDGIYVHALSNELARRGHQVDVIHCVDAYRLMAGREPSASYQNYPNITMHGLKSRFGVLSPLATQQTGFPIFKSAQLRQILKKGFDVIHCHNISLVGGPKILEYGEAVKLYTMHDYWLVCPTHALFRFNRAPCIRPYCFACTLTYKRPPQWWRPMGLMQSAIQHVDAFIAPTRFSKQIHHRMGLDAPIVHVPLFVPIWDNGNTPTAQRTGKDPQQKPYFLFVGRLEKLKGLQTLIPVFRRYDKAQLWIVGEGTYEPHLRQLAEGSKNIRFLGHQTKNELPALYREARAVIVPSICFEVFALIILEAFMHQTPAIVRNIGGMPEIVEESEGGFTYDTDEELLAVMDQLLQRPSCRHELGLNGYNAYRQKWTAEVHLKNYFALIEAIAKNRNRPLAQFAALS